jgi:hypothetical protein
MENVIVDQDLMIIIKKLEQLYAVIEIHVYLLYFIINTIEILEKCQKNQYSIIICFVFLFL